MLDRIRPRLSYANVLSTIALFAVLGGGVAWAQGKIGTKDIRRGAITAPKIKGKAVKGGKLARRAVKPGKIRPGAVKPGKIRPGAVRTNKIEDEAVLTDKIAGDAVTGGKIAPDSIDTAEIRNGAVGTAKIADGAVGTAKIADDAVTAAKLPVTRRIGGIEDVGPGDQELVEGGCQPGETVIGGGGRWNPAQSFDAAVNNLIESYPTDDNTWEVRAFNGQPIDVLELQVVVLCLEAG